MSRRIAECLLVTFVLTAGCGLVDDNVGDADGRSTDEHSRGGQGGAKADRSEPVPGLIGGEQVDDGDFDATVKLEAGCTAAKVGEHHLLLAAHCVAENSDQSLRSEYQPGSTFGLTGKKVAGEDVDYKTRTTTATTIHPKWKTCLEERFGCGRYAHPEIPPHRPDVAIVETEESLSEPYATIDTTRVADGDPLVIMGYGCEESYHGPRPDPPRLKFARTKAVGKSTLGQHKEAYGNYIATAGESTDEGAATLCPGDSGGPVYRDDGTQRTVVGVNSYYLDDGGLSDMSLHTRLGTETRHDVAAWLREHLPAGAFASSNDSDQPDDSPPNDSSGEGCLIISEYVHGPEATDRALEFYNCGEASLSLDAVRLCHLADAGAGCEDEANLTGTVPAGEVTTACHSTGSETRTAIAEHCDLATPAMTNDGDDRYVVYRDTDGDGAFTRETDRVLDAYGPIESTWDPAFVETDMRRCRLEPYRGREAFDPDALFTYHPPTDLGHFGRPPETDSCD